jgi:hypothetical protein
MCPERFKLSQAVAEAVRMTYRAKEDLEAARKVKGANTAVKTSALSDARSNELNAVSVLHEHIETHGCKE